MLASDDDETEDWRDDPDPDPPDLGPDVPEVDIPSVDVATPDSLTPGEDVDSETYNTFWRLVIVMDVAILAFALAPMFVFFEGDWRRGLLLFAFGLTAGAYGVRRYRSYRAGRDEPAETAEPDDAADDPPAASGGGDRQG